MTQQKLNLLQFAASGTTEASATPPEVVRREFPHTNFRSELLDDVPDQLFRNSLAPDSARAANAAEKAATGDSTGLHPVFEETSHPVRNRDGPNVTTLPSQVHDCPLALTLLKVVHGQCGEFMSPKSASQKNCK